jgi:cytochrome c oxidase subunit II
MNISLRTFVTIAVIGVLLIAGGFLFATATPLLFPEQASAEAKQVDDLFRILLVIGGAIFLLVQGLLAFSVWRFRAKAGDTSDGIVMHGNSTLEIIWTAIPAVIVFLLTILSYQVFVSIQSPKDGEVRVQAVGARFSWAFSHSAPIDIYPTAVDPATLTEAAQTDLANDGALTITTPDLHTYVGEPVELVMVPRDVIHSFWVPAFRVKQDLIPGRTTTVRFTPTMADTFPIRCAELCGANHALMVANVIVHPDKASYDEWLVPEMEKIINPPTDPVIVGHNILASNKYTCFTCHVLDIDAVAPWVGNIGPALNGVADRAATSRASATGLTAADYLYQSIHEPSAWTVPGFGPLMPQLNVPECELQAMVAYLCTVSDSGEPQCTIDLDAYAAQCGRPGGATAPSADATAEAASDASLVSEATAEATVSAESTVEATAETTAEATIAADSTAEATASS